MISDFGHHFIPPLPQSGTAEAMGSKSFLAAVKAACKTAEKINRVLKLAGRYEIGVLPDCPEFFGESKNLASARVCVWQMMKDTPRIQWIILTKNPARIKQSLPSNWIGKGFKNVCVGLVLEGGNDCAEGIQRLREAPLRSRMIFVTPSAHSVNLAGQLKEIDWVVYAGAQDPNDSARAEHFRTLCRDSNTAFLFHQPGRSFSCTTPAGSIDGDAASPTHPFGSRIDLSKRTLPALKEVSASLHHPTNPVLNQEPAVSEELPVLRIATDDSVAALPVDPVIAPTATAAAACEVIPTNSITAQTGITEDSRDDFERLDGVVREGLNTFIEVGHALAEIRARELWRVGGHPNWGAYCQEVGGLTKSHGNRLIKSSEVAGHLQQVAPIGVTPRTESQVRPLCRLKSQEQQTIAWTRAVEEAGGIQPTAMLVTSVTNEMLKGENTKANNKPDRRAKLISIYHCLHDAIRNSRPKSELESHMADLGNALGIESPSPPQEKTRTPTSIESN